MSSRFAGASHGEHPERVAALRRRLRRWYRRNRRMLPWRRSRDPYRVWVSEVMLQQTQVATATPVYQTFIERFPTIAELARAPAADVLAAWSGLGYYRRARHLHLAARAVVREHGGRIPRDEHTFGRLPGVGRYTRGAVLSIAFDRPLPVLDGNVARVLARWYAVPAHAREPRGARKLWAIASLLVPMRGAGEWNQALMELGATVCLPRSPRCGECPVRVHCAAFVLGQVERFPPPAKRTAVRPMRREVVVLRRGPRWLMARQSGALLEGLWEPPGTEARTIGEVASRRPVRGDGSTSRRALEIVLARLGVRAEFRPAALRIRQRITNRDLDVGVWVGMVVGRTPRRATLRYVDPDRPRVAITGLARKLARALEHGRATAKPRLRRRTVGV